VAGEGQPSIQYVIARDRPAEIIDRLVANLDKGRLRFGLGGEGDRNQPGVLAMTADHFDNRLVIGMGDHLELAVGQALPAFRALKPARLAAEDIQYVHGFFLPRIQTLKTSKADSAIGR
jgi:hypothetical protein